MTAASGATFEDVDLQEDFADYDGMLFACSSSLENADEAVSVMNMEWTFESA